MTLLIISGLFIPVLEQHVTISVFVQCDDPLPKNEILEKINSVLDKTERCDVVIPCDQWRAVVCQGGVRSFGETMPGVGNLSLGGGVTEILQPYGISSHRDHSKFIINKDLFFIILIYSVLIIEALAVLFALWRAKILRQIFSFPSEGRSRAVIVSAGLAVSAFGVLYLLVSLLEQLIPFPEVESLLESLSKPALIILVVFLAPFIEELLFRGVLLKYFIGKYNALVGTVIVSILFSIIHGFVINDWVWQMFFTSTYFILSVIMCWLYIKYKSVWAPMVFHSVYNGATISAYIVMS
ncbi:MAG: CPBP family intramembrane metalloprotease [Xanthomonadales bacterium]|nr:CPBP family intramembrane metalloprotease [Xanthomonadales bacterium]